MRIEGNRIIVNPCSNQNDRVDLMITKCDGKIEEFLFHVYDVGYLIEFIADGVAFIPMKDRIRIGMGLPNNCVIEVSEIRNDVCVERTLARRFSDEVVLYHRR